MYETAKSDQADTLAEQIMDIADKATPDVVQVARAGSAVADGK